MNTARGNLYGIAAIIMWCTIIGLMRSVTESFGVAAGTALVYTVGSLALCLKNGLPKVKQMPPAYLWGAGFVFVMYEVVFSQGIGISVSHRQTLEVGMLNYLWPCLIVVFSIWINNQKLRWIVWPGTALSVIGLYWCVSAGGEVDLAGFMAGVAETPLPYACGLIAAITWGLYCNLSARFAKGANAVPVFFAAIAVMLWIAFFFRGGQLFFPGIWPVCELIVMGIMFGVSYSMWETGMHHGNFMLLAVLSYFTPAGSMLFASLWLGSIPPHSFWAGVGMVIGGSLLCWLASLKRA